MTIDFNKNTDGLVPAIIQDATTRSVLMLGYMNRESLEKTLQTKHVTFFSRSKQRLWTKGETSGNILNLVDIKVDCDNDALLISVKPEGSCCHKGFDTCWNESNDNTFGFLSELEEIIEDRINKSSQEKSYVSALYSQGINKIAQKVGEEAVELVIESKDTNDDLFLNESADLLFHFLILIQAKGFKLNDVIETLKERR